MFFKKKRTLKLKNTAKPKFNVSSENASTVTNETFRRSVEMLLHVNTSNFNINVFEENSTTQNKEDAEQHHGKIQHLSCLLRVDVLTTLPFCLLTSSPCPYERRCIPSSPLVSGVVVPFFCGGAVSLWVEHSSLLCGPAVSLLGGVACSLLLPRNAAFSSRGW